uniref:Uncharacterized protein n=1 Tax=Grammatophora oceanica TaxID=210454 RepID=A0A7S1Y162_9STRA|mmetsp:Transcript_14108/g.20662  ORF Transcript_14108/g.20662 Transcript_14108/m.20662 type:complete len:148 (+) Transcript_14108:117-560(+)|eukprot:CAMPEP_0194056610 /NCGR_PEP_ID=MMETSP0009_2-20130614/60693_1 /TAXON_ID=210454 /ORGANISM="Grammatophora oceanica, Strain CCMP 410" /LENGTH=147 /DNA_ID=CAMNT_0038706045 /DNA_START=55 /DNA_END=498 /DNA_ORIENTATION=-
MASPALQAKANELNAKMESEARSMLDTVERTQLRKIAKASYQCVVGCFDKAGTTGSSDVLEQCSRSCQLPYQQGNNIVQQETADFQNRLNRAMMACQDQAKDIMAGDASKMPKAEDALLKCISRTVDDHIKMLRPMKARIEGQLKKL